MQSAIVFLCTNGDCRSPESRPKPQWPLADCPPPSYFQSHDNRAHDDQSVSECIPYLFLPFKPTLSTSSISDIGDMEWISCSASSYQLLQDSQPMFCEKWTVSYIHLIWKHNSMQVLRSDFIIFIIRDQLVTGHWHQQATGSNLQQVPASFSFNFSAPTLFPYLSKNLESTIVHFSSS